MHEQMMEEELKGVLERLKASMYQLILKGKGGEDASQSVADQLEDPSGDSTDMGSDMGEENEDLEDKIQDAEEGDDGPDAAEEDPFRDMISGFMRKGKSIPSKKEGTAVMISMKGKSPMKKFMKKGA